MRALILIVTAIALPAPRGAFSQDAGSRVAFEVASVKPSNPNGTHVVGIYTYPGGRLTASFCTLSYVIEEAFDMQPFQITGGPGWIQSDRFDIEAKPPANSKSARSNPNNPKLPPNDEQRQMLQTLLIDRFQLKYHRETTEGAVYSLEQSGKKLALTKAKDPDDFPWATAVTYSGGPACSAVAGINASMALLAAHLSPFLGKPVVDRTGLSGAFDFNFHFAAADVASDCVSNILAAVQPLGLKLKAGRGPIEKLVIDRVEKPAAN